MLFWLILHSLQLSGVETAEPGFSGEEVETKLLKQIKSKCSKNLRGSFLCQKTGVHRRRRWGDPPGSQKGAWWPLPVPPFAYKTSRGQKPLKRSRFHETPPPRCGNLTEEKTHLRRGDSVGEITSRKGRSSTSSSTSSPTPAPSPSTSKLVSQLQLVL